MSAAAEQIDDYVPSGDPEEARRSWRRRTSLEMIISGFIGLVTSFVLSIEAWQLAVDSSARFGCDVSSVPACPAAAPASYTHPPLPPPTTVLISFLLVAT